MENILANPALEISILLLLSIVGYLIAKKIQQSAVVGLILVGILFGPSLFNLITLNEFVENLALMGSIILLFVIGLDTKFKEIYTFKNFIIALGGVIIPWICGYFFAVLMGENTASAIFIGTALTATSIALTVQVLKEFGRINSEAGKAIIGAAVIDDVLALLAIGIASQMAQNALSLEAIALKVAIAVVFLIGSGALGILIFSKLLARIDLWAEKNGQRHITFLGAIAIAFGYAVAAEVVGLSAIVGAFIAGVSLESLKIKSYKEGSEYLEALFVPIFFISLGVLVDVKMLSPEILIFTIILTAIAMLTKFAGCAIPARIFGMNAKDSAIIGAGMMPRGEIAFIAALIGLSSGVISQNVYASILFMGILTTIFTPPILNRFFKSSQTSPAA